MQDGVSDVVPAWVGSSLWLATLLMSTFFNFSDDYRNLLISVSPIGLYTPTYFDVHLFRHVGELRACAIRRAQSLRLDESYISIYDTTTKVLGRVMSHHHPSGITVDVVGIEEPSRGRSCEVHDTCGDIVAKSWRTWRVSSELLIGVLRGGADARTPHSKWWTFGGYSYPQIMVVFSDEYYFQFIIRLLFWK